MYNDSLETGCHLSFQSYDEQLIARTMPDCDFAKDFYKILIGWKIYSIETEM